MLLRASLFVWDLKKERQKKNTLRFRRQKPAPHLGPARVSSPRERGGGVFAQQQTGGGTGAEEGGHRRAAQSWSPATDACARRNTGTQHAHGLVHEQTHRRAARLHIDTSTHTHTHTHTHTASSEFRNHVGSPVPRKPQAGLRSQTGRPQPRDRPCCRDETPPQVAFSGPPRSPWFSKTLNPLEAARGSLAQS